MYGNIMKILLINLKSPVLAGQKKTYMPPVHLWRIRAFLMQLNHFVLICDEHIGEDCRDFLEEKYDIVGISCRFSVQDKECKRVTREAKKYCENIIVGGIHAPYLIEDVFTTCLLGEDYFSNILQNKTLPINDYPYPFFIESEIQKYWDKERPHDLQSKTNKWMPVVTSLGCDRKCGFCGIHDYWGRWQPYSLEYIDRLFGILKQKGIEEIFIEDDNISWNPERFIKIIELIKKYDFWWSCPNGIYIRSLLNDKVFKSLLGSKCWRLSLPFETGSEKTSKLMGLGNKWLNFVSADYIVNRLKKINIKTCGFFIIGYPGETEEDIKMTFDYANHLDLDQRNIYVATPYPGTHLYKECIEKEYIKNTKDFYLQLLYKNAIINTPVLSAERVMQLKREDRKKALKRRNI
jgi:radical SAM superfamily enzyme YgiQ (UPF0313 family)